MNEKEIIELFERINYLEPETVKYSSPVPPTFVLACIKRLTAEIENLRHIIRVTDEHQDELINTISQKEAEIERLEKHTKEVIENCRVFTKANDEANNKRFLEAIEVVKSEAIKEFAERLKAEKFTHKNFGELVYVEDIDNLVKEMTENDFEE